LFSAGEQGAWYDPSDLTTLFDDSAGTTPVTAPGNGADVWVGLMLDKSKGLVLGSELVTNGGPNIASLTNWQFQANASGSLSSGEIAVTLASSSSRAAYQDITTVIGKWYKVTVTARTANGSLTVGAYDTSFVTIQANTQSATGVNQTLSVYFAATATTTRIAVFQSASGSSTAYNVVSASLRELPGNHATSTGTKRPKLAARYNLLTYTEQFDNGAWTKRGINAFGSGSVANTTATTDPLGGNTADYIQEDTSSGAHGVDNVQSLPNATSFTFSVYCKAAQRTWAYIRLAVTTGQGAFFNLSNGTVGTVQSGITASISNAGNGWYRCSVSITTTTAAGWYPAVCPAPGDNQSSYTGDGTSGIYIWGADLRPASQATGLIGPTYQRVVDAATYDTAGFLPYLQFDGIDDSMSTGSIDFTATDKMTVWAGVRKLSDSTAIAFETSSDYNSNTGSFISVTGSNVAPTDRYSFASRGTGAVANTTASTSVGNAPDTAVITGTGNISGDLNTVRRNGVLGTNATADLGAGNFGNYPLFIGARNNASLYFNGWLTSLIVRGAQSTQSQIEATEAWVNQRTGAY
jgi:hypothetical protein